MSITKLTPGDAGCFIAGHHGQYGSARMVLIAKQFGFDEDAELIDIAQRHQDSMMPSNTGDITDDEHDRLCGSLDTIEAWLTDNVAPEGFSFGWSDGEFYLASDDDWMGMTV